MQEVASGIDQQSTAMDEVAEMAQAQSARAETLKEKTSEFKIDTDQSASLSD